MNVFVHKLFLQKKVCVCVCIKLCMYIYIYIYIYHYIPKISHVCRDHYSIHVVSQVPLEQSQVKSLEI